MFYHFIYILELPRTDFFWRMWGRGQAFFFFVPLKWREMFIFLISWFLTHASLYDQNVKGYLLVIKTWKMKWHCLFLPDWKRLFQMLVFNTCDVLNSWHWSYFLRNCFGITKYFKILITFDWEILFILI